MIKVRRVVAGHLCSAVFSIALVLGQGLVGPTRAETALLRTVENDVARRWPNILHMPANELAEAMQGGKIVLFDVREEQEFRVSRIQGALRVDPRIGRAEFLRQHAGALDGKMVVFYCAVGQRSSRLADRMAGDMKARGATAVYNLRGGIFAWHNGGYPLVDGAGPTEYVHPFSQAWGRVLTRQHLLRTTPAR
jgi:rhodanese-related sulfurtransferase